MYDFIALNPNIDVIVGAGIGSGILLVTVIIGIAVCVCCFFGCKKGSNRSDKKSSKVQSSDMQMQQTSQYPTLQTPTYATDPHYVQNPITTYPTDQRVMYSPHYSQEYNQQLYPPQVGPDAGNHYPYYNYWALKKVLWLLYSCINELYNYNNYITIIIQIIKQLLNRR